MSKTTLQLRVGATQDRSFLFRTCVRPPATVTVGRQSDATLPLQADDAPLEHPLFSLGSASCLVDALANWPISLYQGDEVLRTEELLLSGMAVRSGRRILLRVAPGTRGSVTIGPVRLLFKFERVVDSPVGEVPLRDLGAVPRCHACGLAMRDALPREGLLARCDACRAMNRFVDPDAPYRTLALPPAPQLAQLTNGDGGLDSSAGPSGISEELDTLLGVPIFAPGAAALELLPQHAQPAGRPGRPSTPGPLKVARDPAVAVEKMQTLLGRSPLIRSAAKDSGADSFFQAEVEALELPAPTTISSLPTDSNVAWNTVSVLSADARFQPAEGRIPRAEVADAVHEARPLRSPLLGEQSALLIALGGLTLLALGVLALTLDRTPPPPEPSEPPAPVEPPPAPVDVVILPPATYISYAPELAAPTAIKVAAFSIDRYEITWARYQTFLAAAAPDAAPGPRTRGALPVTGLSFAEAQAFCRWASGRLPSEAEWERAAVGSYGRMFPWGNRFRPDAVARGASVEPVGSHPDGASESGVHDLIGNAAEWVNPPDGVQPFLKGGGAGAFAEPAMLMVFGRIAAPSELPAPGAGARCAYDP